MYLEIGLLILTILVFAGLAWWYRKAIIWEFKKYNWKKLLAVVVVASLAATGTVLLPVGDPPVYPDGSPYDYWYAPPNSFGISETKSVNWTYFKQLFLAHTDWMLEARIGTGEWFNADEYLTIERTWNESGFWKFNLILDKPEGSPMVDARFTFGSISRPILSSMFVIIP